MTEALSPARIAEIRNRLDAATQIACAGIADVDFIAHAPTDLRALLDYTERLVAENEKLRGERG